MIRARALDRDSGRAARAKAEQLSAATAAGRADRRSGRWWISAQVRAYVCVRARYCDCVCVCMGVRVCMRACVRVRVRVRTRENARVRAAVCVCTRACVRRPTPTPQVRKLWTIDGDRCV